MTGVEPAADEFAVDDSPKEACGVFGVYAPGQPVAHLTYLGLYALQHRGQESAGIAVSDGETITVVKDMGLVTQVFDERTLAPLDGHLAIGHVATPRPGRAPGATRSRSTAPSATPASRSATTATSPTPRRSPPSSGCCPGAVTTDSELIAELLGAELRAPARRAAPTAATSSSRCSRCCPGSRARSRSC